MSRPKSKPTEGWAKLLQAEIARRGTAWTEEHKSLEELCAMRKRAGLPSSKKPTQTWVRGEIQAGRIERVEGLSVRAGKLVRASRYLVK